MRAKEGKGIIYLRENNGREWGSGGMACAWGGGGGGGSDALPGFAAFMCGR